MRRSPLGIIFLTVALDLVGFGIVLPLLPGFARQPHHASNFQIGLLMASYSLMQFLFSPVWGRLSDRIGRRPVLLISLSGSVLSYLLFAIAPNLALLFVSRLFAGAMAANIATAQAYVADVTAPEDRAKGMGMVGAAFGIGFIFGPAIGGVLSHGPGSQLAVGLAAAGFSLLDLVLAALFLPESLTPELRARAASAPGSRIGRMVAALRHPTIGIPVLIFFISTVAWSQLEPTVVLLSQERFGFTMRQTGYMFAYLGLVSALVQGGFAGRMARRAGETRMVVAGTLLVGIGLALVPLAGSGPWLLTVMTVLAVGQALNVPGLQSLISRSAARDEQGGTLGVTQGFSSLARVVGPAAGGWLYGIRFGYPFWLGSGLMILSFALAAGLASAARREKSR